MKASPGLTATEAIVILAVVVILCLLLFPSTTGPGLESSGKVQAKNDVTQIATAIVAFETEYGRLPATGRQVVSGEMLAALTGSNSTINPRNIVFIETREFKPGRGGLSNGLWLDPGGVPYQVALAEGTNQFVLAGTNDIEVKKRVAAWADPRLEPPPPWWSLSKKPGSRYVTSWD